MGRKGIGKLAVFGVARIVEIETRKDGKLTAFRMDLEEIKAKSRTGEISEYQPEVLVCQQKTERANGTIIKLRYLKRCEAIDEVSIRKRLARRFSVIGQNFDVFVNNTSINPEDRLLKNDLEYIWNVENESIAEQKNWVVSGWIGTLKESVEDIDPGVIIMARGKLIQEPFFFTLSAGEKYAFNTLVGELNAEFLDEEEDLIAAYRGSAIWDSPQGSALSAWGQKKLLKIAEEWSEKRRQKRESAVRENPEFKDWLGTLTGPEKKIADKVVKIVTSEEKLNEERRIEIMSYVKTSFDQQAFRELIVTLDEKPSAANLLLAFEEWRVIEAREVLRLMQGRLDAIKQFDRMIKTDAREVPTLHQFFVKFPWILDPSWLEVYDEETYSALLRKEFPDDNLDGPDRRIDFVCMGVGDTCHIVELKRPGHKINWRDLDQLEQYVAFIRGQLGNSPRGRSYRSAAGYIVAGGMVDTNQVHQKKENLERSRMYVLKYEDCLRGASRLHKIFEDKLEEFNKAPKSI